VKEIRIDDKIIAKDSPIYFIAEIGENDIKKTAAPWGNQRIPLPKGE